MTPEDPRFVSLNVFDQKEQENIWFRVGNLNIVFISFYEVKVRMTPGDPRFMLFNVSYNKEQIYIIYVV